jgi:phosphatidylserine decarboxylase
MFTHREVRREMIRMIGLESVAFLPSAVGFLMTGYRVLGILSVLLLGLMIMTAYFFRDPERIPIRDGNMILSPADGKVVEIGMSVYPGTERPAQRIAIFLSVFNVHVNRIPVSGIVQRLEYRPGMFLPAFRSEASEKNERSEIWIQTGQGDVVVRQITGIIARRIVCGLEESEKVEAGDRFGLIRFGSRAELFFPTGFRMRVAPGDRVIAGITAIGVFIS